MKKQGFTLIELLAVITILGIILAIAVPNIVGLIEKATREAFLVDAKNVLRAVDYYLLDKEEASLLNDLDVNSLENTLNIGSSNYSSIKISFDRHLNPFIKLVGKNKWEGLMACGTFTNLKIGSNKDCDVPTFPTKLPGGQLCGSVFYDGRDGNKYKTVQIGEQCWFGENLRYTGSGCLVNSIDDWKNESPYGACLMHIEEKGALNGVVPDWAKNKEVTYQWGAAMNGKLNPQTVEDRQGLCPKGWHLPTDAEWGTLIDGLSGSAGVKLKSTPPDWDGEEQDNSGFNARPIGYRYTSGDLLFVGFYAGWWSSSSGEDDNAWSRTVQSSTSGVFHKTSPQAYGYSIRCVLD
ncbi:MAG: FISUMP domain-containing protein [Bacilli bacterium]